MITANDMQQSQNANTSSNAFTQNNQNTQNTATNMEIDSKNKQDIYDKDGETVITAALRSKQDISQIGDLIKKLSHNINQPNKKGETPIQVALQSQYYPDDLFGLIRLGIDCRNMGDAGSVYLEQATTNWHDYDVAKLLAKHYPIKDIHADAISNVMYYADHMKNGDFELFSLLAEKNDIQKLQSLVSESYIHALVKAWTLRGQGGQSFTDKKQTLEILKILIKKFHLDPNVDESNNTGDDITNSLHMMSLMSEKQESNLHIIRLLIEGGSKVNAQECSGNTALILAASVGNWNLALELVAKYQAEANIANSSGQSAFSYAIDALNSKRGNLQSIITLLKTMISQVVGKGLNTELVDSAFKSLNEEFGKEITEFYQSAKAKQFTGGNSNSSQNNPPVIFSIANNAQNNIGNNISNNNRNNNNADQNCNKM